jgi:predicted O-methyltransferase YrrM
MATSVDATTEVTDHYVFLQLLHDVLQPQVYLETGVESGRTLALARGIGIGIDPDPKVTHNLAQGAQVFSVTSDEFFASHALPSLTGGRPIDLAFIDGLHLFENALKDFINIERHAHPGTVVCVHDVLPETVKMASREVQNDGWTGDVFGLVLALREHRPDLVTITISVPQTGMLLVTNLNSSDSTLSDLFESIMLRHLAVDYARIHANRDKIFGVVPFSPVIADYCAAKMAAHGATSRLYEAATLLGSDKRIRMGFDTRSHFPFLKGRP